MKASRSGIQNGSSTNLHHYPEMDFPDSELAFINAFCSALPRVIHAEDARGLLCWHHVAGKA